MCLYSVICALAVICLQMPALPSGEPRSGSEFLAFTHNPTCLSLWERCRAATERACISRFPSQAYLIRICSFALVQTCSCAALSVICYANASSPKGRAKKPVRAGSLTNQGTLMQAVRGLLLPSRLAPRHLPQGGRLLQLVSIYNQLSNCYNKSIEKYRTKWGREMLTEAVAILAHLVGPAIAESIAGKISEDGLNFLVKKIRF